MGEVIKSRRSRRSSQLSGSWKAEQQKGNKKLKDKVKRTKRPGSRIHASPQAWLAGSERPRRLQDKKCPHFLVDTIFLKVKILQILHRLQELLSSFEIILIFGIFHRLQEP